MAVNRSRAYNRYQRYTHIERKKKIIKEQGGYWHFLHDGELSKGKIHCSCPYCRRKSQDSLKISDRRRIESLEDPS